MKKKFLTAVSVIAVLCAAPAFAETKAEARANAQSDMTVGRDVKQGWENTKEAVSEAAEDVSDAAKDTYENIKAAFIDEKSHSSTVTIDPRMTADGMIGQPVYNSKNERIASIYDIVLDQDGKAQMVIVADGGVFGLGSKYVAFDYGLVSQRQADGDVIMPITQETLDKAAAFSYDARDRSDKIRVIPANGISVNELLKAEIIDPAGKSVANVDNISLRGGEASQLIIAFDQVLGMGGEKAAMNYDDVQLVRNDDNSIDFKLNTNQTAQFESYKKVSAN